MNAIDTNVWLGREGAMGNSRSAARQRRSVAVIAVMLVFALAVALLLWLGGQPHPRITEENFRKLKHGMTQQEVVSVLGGPAGDYASGRRYCVIASEGSTCSLFDNPWRGRKAVPPEKIQPVSPNGKTAFWRGKDYAIGVEFDENGTVRYAGAGWAPQEPTVLEQIRAWLGL